MTIRILLVDDDPLVITGLRLLLGGAPALEVVGSAADGDELCDAVTLYAPDVVLLDVRMARMDGVTALRELRSRPGAQPAIIMLTTFNTDSVVLEALRHGASGFLLKHTAPEQIVTAIRAAAIGEATVSPGVLRQLIAHVASDSADSADPLDSLTAREREVALAVADGLSNAEVAQRLFLSVGSVKTHISSSLAKLALENRVQLAIAAHESRGRASEG